MRKFNLFILLAAILITFGSCKTVKIPEEAPMGVITADLAYLAQDYLEGRETGTEGERKAAEYIIKRFKEIGLSPLGTDGYYQIFERKIKTNPHADAPSDDDPSITVRNVVGFKDNGQPYTIVIGAHYDHLGYGAEGSLYTGPAEIHNGADDNASGVTAMLYLASLLTDNADMGNYNYLFIGFSGEEKGLWGSNYYTDHPTLDLNKVTMMINMDMVGRLNSQRQLAISGTGTSPIFDKLLDRSNRTFSLKKTPSGIGPSDHTSFYLKDIPVLFFFTGQHEDYHKPSDDLEKINFNGLRDISHYIYGIIGRIQKKGDIPFTKTKDDTQETPSFNITLGVIPDYLYDGKGMRIDGVREGKTADIHGFLNGDIVTKMGELEVIDMKTYMKALSVYKPGDTLDVTIIRDGKTLVKKVTF